MFTFVYIMWLDFFHKILCFNLYNSVISRKQNHNICMTRVINTEKNRTAFRRNYNNQQIVKEFAMDCRHISAV